LRMVSNNKVTITWRVIFNKVTRIKQVRFTINMTTRTNKADKRIKVT
jgi:hypothetical protein